MIHKPIYEPKARAREYGDMAINIYRGCNHGCTYCFAPGALRMSREAFSNVTLRRDIVESVKRQLEREQITGKLIHLCFTCDPYPADIDTTPTREIIKLIKDSGNNVQLLTKGGKRALRDFDLLTPADWFGVTISGHALHVKEQEPRAAIYSERMFTLAVAANRGVKTWVSFEPVYDEQTVYDAITGIDYIDLYRIGKLNHHPSGINWAEFGLKCVTLCKQHGRRYYIKDDLRAEIEKVYEIYQYQDDITITHKKRRDGGNG